MARLSVFFSLLLALLAGAPAQAAPALPGPLVPAGWLAAHLDDPGLAVIDLRPASAWQAGHIPGAIGADYTAVPWRVATPSGARGALPPPEALAATIGRLGVADTDAVVLLADDFDAAARVYWSFKVLGHDAVAILEGGPAAWTGALAHGATPARGPASFTAHYTPALRAELPEVMLAASTGAARLVDARPSAQYAAGHIPGAISLDQHGALAAPARLRPREALAALFAPVGERPAIAYCNTGHFGAADWFVLSEVLHHPAKLYDGSMTEWTADPARPVAR